MNKNFSRVGIVVALGLICGLGAAPVLAQSEAASGQPNSKQLQEDLKYAKSISRAFNHAATAIAPSVVHITELSKVYQQRGFFGPVEAVVRPTGAGSGVIVSADGYILTNNHVIDGAEKVLVKLADGVEYDGKVIGTDPATDLGVVKIDASDLKAAAFGDSDSLDVGEWVLAVGSPFGEFDNTVTAGIVSAMGRTGLAKQSEESFQDFIQTDAAINPGNSGGPLVNLEGQVVGINSQIASRTGGSVGIGFSIPSSIARSVMDQLVKTGHVERGAIGINFPDPQSTKAAGVQTGALISNVVTGSPADKAGLHNGDVITRFNGRVIDNSNRLRNAIAFTVPGTAAEIEVTREGKKRDLTVTVGDRGDLVPGFAAVKHYGFSVKDLPSQISIRFDDGRQVQGVVVVDIEPFGPAATATIPLQPNDIIVNVAGQPVPDEEHFDEVMKKQTGKVRLDIIRGPQRGYIDIPARK
jgi:serine protease Do